MNCDYQDYVENGFNPDEINELIDGECGGFRGFLSKIDSGSPEKYKIASMLLEECIRNVHDGCDDIIEYLTEICDDSEIDCNKILLIQSNYNLENQYEEFCNKN